MPSWICWWWCRWGTWRTKIVLWWAKKTLCGPKIAHCWSLIRFLNMSNKSQATNDLRDLPLMSSWNRLLQFKVWHCLQCNTYPKKVEKQILCVIHFFGVQVVCDSLFWGTCRTADDATLYSTLSCRRQFQPIFLCHKQIMGLHKWTSMWQEKKCVSWAKENWPSRLKKSCSSIFFFLILWTSFKRSSSTKLG